MVIQWFLIFRKFIKWIAHYFQLKYVFRTLKHLNCDKCIEFILKLFMHSYIFYSLLSNMTSLLFLHSLYRTIEWMNPFFYKIFEFMYLKIIFFLSYRNWLFLWKFAQRRVSFYILLKSFQWKDFKKFPIETQFHKFHIKRASMNIAVFSFFLWIFANRNKWPDDSNRIYDYVFVMMANTKKNKEEIFNKVTSLHIQMFNN